MFKEDMQVLFFQFPSVGVDWISIKDGVDSKFFLWVNTMLFPVKSVVFIEIIGVFYSNLF